MPNTTNEPDLESCIRVYQQVLAQQGLEHPTDLPDSFYRRLARKLAYEPTETVTQTVRQVA